MYDVKFHLDLRPGEPPVFAVAVGNQIEIYKCEPEGSCTLLLCFAEQGVRFTFLIEAEAKTNKV